MIAHWGVRSPLHCAAISSIPRLSRFKSAILRRISTRVIQRELTNLHAGVTGRQHDKSTCAQLYGRHDRRGASDRAVGEVATLHLHRRESGKDGGRRHNCLRRRLLGQHHGRARQENTLQPRGWGAWCLPSCNKITRRRAIARHQPAQKNRPATETNAWYRHVTGKTCSRRRLSQISPRRSTPSAGPIRHLKKESRNARSTSH